MSILDDPAAAATLDPQGMGDLTAAFPDQVRRAAVIAAGIDLEGRERPGQVVVAGLGGSAIGGDVIRTALGGALAAPMLVVRDYALPAWTGPSTLVVASSYSGNTEETLEAYAQARRAKASIVCITSGGTLAGEARRDGVPVVQIPGGLPPRAALGYSAICLLGVLRAARLVEDQTAAQDETIDMLDRLAARYGASAPERANPAKRLARALYGKVVAIYGSAGLMEAAALRWRGQIEENAKNLAFHHLLPEMNHNELVGWQCPAGALRSVGVVFLRDRLDHPQVQRRFELTREAVGACAGAVEEVWSEGSARLARIFSLAYLSDFVSLYLARLNGVEALPVEAIESLKARLKDSR